MKARFIRGDAKRALGIGLLSPQKFCSTEEFSQWLRRPSVRAELFPVEREISIREDLSTIDRLYWEKRLIVGDLQKLFWDMDTALRERTDLYMSNDQWKTWKSIAKSSFYPNISDYRKALSRTIGEIIFEEK